MLFYCPLWDLIDFIVVLFCVHLSTVLFIVVYGIYAAKTLHIVRDVAFNYNLFVRIHVQIVYVCPALISKLRKKVRMRNARTFIKDRVKESARARDRLQ